MADEIFIQTLEQLFEQVKIDGPAWYPVRDRTGGNLWLVRCPHSQKKVHLSSDLERDCWYLLVFNQGVAWYCEHPLKVSYPVDGKVISTIFDFLIQSKNGDWSLKEIKIADTIAPEKISKRTRNQLSAQQGWADKHGADYEVVLDTEIRKNKLYLYNLKQILPYLRTHRGLIPRYLSKPLLTILKNQSEVPLRVLEETLSPDNTQIARRLIFYYLLAGELRAPLETEQLTGRILISRAHDKV